MSASNFLENWTEIFDKVDTDGNGGVDFQEFVTASIDHKKNINNESLRMAFDRFDINKDGTISIDEFKVIMPCKSGNSANEMNKTWMKIIEDADTNGDGQV